MGTSTRTSNGTSGDVDGRRLPDGVGGMLVVGLLRHVAPSTHSKKQLLFDVEVINGDGRVAIESMSGWLMDAGDDGSFTELGAAFAKGEFGPLVGKEVCCQVSARASATKSGARLYITVESIWELGLDRAAPAAEAY